MRQPTGGPKDIDAPLLTSAEPADRAVNVSTSRIVLRFNERIKLAPGRDKILISPPLDIPPEIRQSGAQQITVDLKADLAPNTTYLFNLGEAISDLTEGNKADGLVYVISTGDHLDSLTLTGSVQDAYSGTPSAGVLVMLYAPDDTAAFRRTRPRYFTRTDASGNFLLSYLRPGSMSLFALKDQNGDLRYDLPNEEIAFWPNTVELPIDSAAKPPRLRLFREASAQQSVLSYSVLPERAWQMVFARRAAEVELRPNDTDAAERSWWFEWNRGMDTLIAWPLDTTLMRDQRFIISEQGKDLDTLTYRVKAAAPFALELRVLPSDSANSLRFRASRPIASWDSTRFQVKKAGTVNSLMIQQDQQDLRILRVKTYGSLTDSVELLLLPRAVRDIHGGRNDSLLVKLKRPTQAVGELVLTFDRGVDSLGIAHVQLLDANGRVTHQVVQKSAVATHVIAEVAPGSYTLKAILDRNANGHWDTGKLHTFTLPEAVLIHPDKVTVRVDWEIAVDWNVENSEIK